MTRSERIRVACERFAEGRPDEMAETVNQGIEAALDAALADLSGLDGLDALARRVGAGDDYADHLAGRTTERAQEIDALRADRDTLREALSLVLASQGGAPEVRDAERALRDSEAGP